MRTANRILLLWLIAAVALSVGDSPCLVLAGSDASGIPQLEPHNSTAVHLDAKLLDSVLLPAEPAACESSLARWGEENLRPVLSAWNFSAQEEVGLLELRDRLRDVDHWKNDPAEVARFLKEHDFDVVKAERMFRGMIQWRTDNNVDAFMEHYGEPPDVFHYAPLFLLKGLDNDGDPIFVLRIGSLDAWGLHQRLGETAMLEANRFVSEIQTSRDVGIPEEWKWQKRYYEPLTGRRVTQFTILVDLDGLGTRLLKPALLSFLQNTARIAQDHYPGLAKRIIVLRAPLIFKMAWKVAKHFYDARVHDKFRLTNHFDYLEVLSEYMDLKVLPSIIYPEGNGTQMPGFFEKIRMEGGLIPPPNKADGDSLDPSLEYDTVQELAPPIAPELATAG